MDQFGGFFGEHRARKEISLGGRKDNRPPHERHHARNDFVRAQQQERYERQRQRLCEHAARSIQIYYRRYRRWLAYCQSLREELDSEWRHFFLEKRENIKNEELFRWSRILIAFYQQELDEQRLLQLCKWLLEGNVSYLYYCFEENELEKRITRTLVQWKRLAIFCVKLIMKNSWKSEHYSVLQWMRLILDRLVWKKAAVDDLKAIEIIYYLHLHLLKHGLLEVFQDMNISDKNHATKEITLIADWIFEPIVYQLEQKIPSKIENIYATSALLFQNILSIPLMMEKLDRYKDHIKQIQILDIILLEVDHLNNPNPNKLIILENLIIIDPDKLAQMKPDLLVRYVKATCRLLELIDTHLFEHEMEDAFTMENTNDKEMTTVEIPEIDRRTAYNIVKHLENINYWKTLAYALLPNDSDDHFEVINRYFVVAMVRISLLRSKLANILAFSLDASRSHSSIAKNIWERKLRQNIEAFSFEGKESSILVRFLEGQGGIYLYLVCIITYQQLLVSGDDDILQYNCFNLGREELANFAQLLKNIAIYLFINVNIMEDDYLIGDRAISLINFKQIMVSLLQHLHDRDARCQLFNSDFWLMKKPISIPEIDEDILGLLEESEGKSQGSQIQSYFSRRQPNSVYAAVTIMVNIPFVLSFAQRVEIFRQIINKDKIRSNVIDEPFFSQNIATIRRSFVFEDGFSELNFLGPKLKGRLRISFVNDLGLPEAGIDGGGVFKEFMTEMAKKVFNEDYGLFKSTRDRYIYPNPHIVKINEDALNYVQFLGQILAKALYESVLIDVPFAGFFLSKLLGKTNYLDDLSSLDPELYKNLIFLKRYEGNIEDLCLTFSVVHNEFGESQNIDLIPDGKDIPVTNMNRMRYIYCLAHYKLNGEIQLPCKAFLKGFSDIIHPRWIRIFNPQELRMLICGASVPIDLEDMKNNTNYSGGYSLDHPVIVFFWKVVSEFNEYQKGQLLKFITSCSRPPLLGFRELHPSVCIHSAGLDEDRLPTSSTCMNLLKLPEFSNESILRDKLLYALESSTGFELS